MTNKVKTFLLIVLSSVFLAGCFFNSDDNDQSKLFDEEVVVKDNDKELYLSEIMSHVKIMAYNLPDFKGLDEVTLKDLYKNVLNQIAIEEMLIQEANKKNLEVENDELQIYINQIMPTSSFEEMEFSLKKRNISIEEWKERKRRILIVNKLIKQEVLDKIETTEEEIEEERKRSIKEATKKYQVYQIMVQAPELAELILKDLKKGATFEDYVDKYSISPDKVNNGEMGLIEPGVLPKELEDAIFKLKKVNDISPVIKSPLGYHIFRLSSVVDNKNQVPKLEDLTDAVKINKFQAAYTVWIDYLREKTDIQMDEEILISESQRF